MPGRFPCLEASLELFKANSLSPPVLWGMIDQAVESKEVIGRRSSQVESRIGLWSSYLVQGDACKLPCSVRNRDPSVDAFDAVESHVDLYVESAWQQSGEHAVPLWFMIFVDVGDLGTAFLLSRPSREQTLPS